MKRLRWALVAWAVIAGCGTLSGPRTGTISPPTDALAQWQNFPADQVPRPIVLLSTDSPGQGFDTNDAKIAALCGKLAVGISLPADTPKEATSAWADGTTVTYPAISAADAFAAMTVTSPGKSGSMCQAAPPLTVTATRFGVAYFATDRGKAKMSAWMFKATGAWAEFIYPAIAPTAFWTGGLVGGSIGGGASVSASGRQLTFGFVGGPPDGPCAEDYSGVVAESPHAVAIAVQSNPGRPQAGPIACDLVGHMRSITVHLASPLGGRVLVDASGAAVEACPEAIRAGCF